MKKVGFTFVCDAYKCAGPFRPRRLLLTHFLCALGDGAIQRNKPETDTNGCAKKHALDNA